MGKTPKKAAPGGDERNLYVRRLKATTATSRASESSFLPERQRESEGPNRPKLTGIQKKIPTGSEKNFKSKLRTPAKVGLNQPTKQLKLPMKNSGPKVTDMQSEPEEAKVELNVSIQKENCKEETLSSDKAAEIEESITDKERIDDAVSEQVTSEPQTSAKTVQEIILVDSEIISQKKGDPLENTCNAGIKEVEEQEDNDIKLTFEQSPKKDEDGQLDAKQSKNDDKEEELSVVQDELKNGVNDKEEMQNEAPIDIDSCSVNIKSTTSELSSVSELVTSNDMQKSKEKTDDPVNNDAPVVSYDASITLKDIQIRLIRAKDPKAEDSLKDNSKLFDANDAEDAQCQSLKDISFGKLLRNISGRRSLGRMVDKNHFTSYERRISPNSSLFVNTSTMSTLQEDEGTESKILHYSSGLSDSFPTNGSSYGRKRKIDTQIWDSAKKQRTESSLLNTSIGLLKSLSRPIQVSTPNATPYKFETKLDISGIKDDDNKTVTEPTESTKKWCVIM